MRISAAGHLPPSLPAQQDTRITTPHTTAKGAPLPTRAKPWGLSPAPCNLLPSKRFSTSSSTAQQQGPGCRHQVLQAAGERPDGDMAAATSYLPCKVAPSSRGGKSGKVTPARTSDHQSPTLPIPGPHHNHTLRDRICPSCASLSPPLKRGEGAKTFKEREPLHSSRRAGTG